MSCLYIYIYIYIYEQIQKFVTFLKSQKKAIFTEIGITLVVVLVTPSNVDIWCITTLLTDTI